MTDDEGNVVYDYNIEHEEGKLEDYTSWE